MKQEDSAHRIARSLFDYADQHGCLPDHLVDWLTKQGFPQNTAQKNAEECYALYHLREAVFPHWRWSQIEGGETPDFIVRRPCRVIGIEHTAYHVSQESRRIESAWLKTAKPAIETGLASFDDLTISISFHDKPVLNQKDLAGIVADLKNIVGQHYATLSDKQTIFCPCDPDPNNQSFSANNRTYVFATVLVPFLKKFVQHIYLTRQQARHSIYVSSNIDVAYIPTDEERVIGVVGNKLNVARPCHIDRFWLLISVGGMLSQQLDEEKLPELERYSNLNQLLESSTFDKVFLSTAYTAFVWCWKSKRGWYRITPSQQR